MSTSGPGGGLPPKRHVARTVSDFNQKAKEAEKSKGIRPVDGEQVHPGGPSKTSGTNIKERTATPVPVTPQINPDAREVARSQASYLQQHTVVEALRAQKDLLQHMDPIKLRLNNPDMSTHELPFIIVHVKDGKMIRVIPLDESLKANPARTQELREGLKGQLDTIDKHYTREQVHILNSRLEEAGTKLHALAMKIKGLGAELPEISPKPRVIYLDVKRLTEVPESKDPATGQTTQPKQKTTDSAKGHFELRPRKDIPPKPPEPVTTETPPVTKPGPLPKRTTPDPPPVPLPLHKNTIPDPPPLPGGPQSQTPSKRKKGPPPAVPPKPQGYKPKRQGVQPKEATGTGQTAAGGETQPQKETKPSPEVSPLWLKLGPKTDAPGLQQFSAVNQTNLKAANVFLQEDVDEDEFNVDYIASVNVGSPTLEIGQGAVSKKFSDEIPQAGNYKEFHRVFLESQKGKTGFFTQVSERKAPLAAGAVYKPDKDGSNGHEGTVFIDVFSKDGCPHGIPQNKAMIYVVPPRADKYATEEELLQAVSKTAANLYLAQNTFNRQAALSSRTDVPSIPVLRISGFSSTIALSGKTTKEKAHAALIGGLDQARNWLADNNQPNTIREIQYAGE